MSKRFKNMVESLQDKLDFYEMKINAKKTKTTVVGHLAKKLKIKIEGTEIEQGTSDIWEDYYKKTKV